MKFSKDIAHQIKSSNPDDILTHSWAYNGVGGDNYTHVFECKTCHCIIHYNPDMKWGLFLDIYGDMSFNTISCDSFKVRDIIL